MTISQAFRHTIERSDLSSMEGAFTFQWRIENFSYCVQKTGEILASPAFVVDDLRETQWRLRLYPRGHQDDKHVNVYICRENTGPERLKVHYELSFITHQNTTHLIGKGCTTDFQRNAVSLLPKRQIEREEFEAKKHLFLKDDALTVRCRLWKPDSQRGEAVRCFGLTRIGVERRSIVWAIEEFSTLRLKESWSTKVTSGSVMHPPHTLSVTLTGKSIPDSSVDIGVSLVNTRYPKLLTCKVSVLDHDGKEEKESQAKYWLETKRENQEWTFSDFITRRELFKRRDDLLVDDVLIVCCEFSISSGVELEKIEGTHYVPTFLESHVQLNCSDDSPTQSIVEESSVSNNPIKEEICVFNIPIEEMCDCLTVLQDDLKSLYVDRTLTDFKLRTEDVSFPVHKVVLSARSPVFRDMFARGVESEVLDIPDLDSDTLEGMLTFLYTGTTDRVQQESVAKLYYAADKFEVLSLKQRCSSYLMANLGVSTVCEVLELATRHGDDGLKSAAVDYMIQRWDEVITSMQWKRFMECNLELAAKTLHLIFSKKGEVKE